MNAIKTVEVRSAQQLSALNTVVNQIVYHISTSSELFKVHIASSTYYLESAFVSHAQKDCWRHVNLCL